MTSDVIPDLKRRMDGAIEALEKDLGGLRTGRASTALLDPITVDCYGSEMPLNQVGNLSVPEARLITVQVWDKAMVGPVEKAIRESGLGLNPSPDGQLIRVPLPDLSEERRRELVKIARKYGESAKIAIRSVRRDGMDKFKTLQKEGDISEDDQKRYSEEIQALTDEHVKNVDKILEKKEKDILKV